MNNTYHIQRSEIIPIGNFEPILTKLATWLDETIKICEETNEYNSNLSKIIRTIVSDLGFIEVLESSTEDSWDAKEAIQCLLFAHILLIRANSAVHKYLNNITPEDEFTQLIDYINTKQQHPTYSHIILLQ